MAKLLLLIFVLLSNAYAKELNIGDTAPNYFGSDINKQKISLGNYQDKVIIISFWASWCDSCIKELNNLQSIQDDFGTDKLAVIAINFKENKKKFKSIQAQLSHLNIILTQDKMGKVANKFSINTIPLLFIIGKDGTLKYTSSDYGKDNMQKIINEVNKAL